MTTHLPESVREIRAPRVQYRCEKNPRHEVWAVELNLTTCPVAVCRGELKRVGEGSRAKAHTPDPSIATPELEQ